MRVLQFLTAVLLSQLTLTPHTKKSNALSLKNCNSCSDFLMLVEMARGSLVLWSVLILQSCHLFGKCLAALEDACDCDAVEIVTTTDVVLRKHGQLLGRYGLAGDDKTMTQLHGFLLFPGTIDVTTLWSTRGLHTNTRVANTICTTAIGPRGSGPWESSWGVKWFV